MGEADKARRRMMGESEPPNPHYKYQNSRDAEKSNRKDKSIVENVADCIPRNWWLRNGQLPSLWTMARLQLALAILNIVIGFILSVLSALFTLGVAGEYGASVAASFVISAFTFATSTALLLFGSAFTSYLARLNDRQTENLMDDKHQMSSPQAKQPSPPAGGIVPKGPLTDLAVNEPPFKPGLQTHEEE